MLTPERINEIAIEAGFTKTLDGSALVVPSPHHDARPYVLKLARAIEQAASIHQQALEYLSLFDQCSEALDRVKALEAKCALLAASLAQEEARSAELEDDRDSWRDQASQRVADWDEMRKERDEAKANAKRLEFMITNINRYRLYESKGYWYCAPVTSQDWQDGYRTAREAIDAALQAEKETRS